MTGYFFQGATCSCNSPYRNRDAVHVLAAISQRLGSAPSPSSSPSGGASEADFCPRCGLNMVPVDESKKGSITAYLFQDLRCKCPPDPTLSPGYMTAALLKLQQAAADETFIDQGEAGAGGNRAGKLAVNLRPGAIIGGVYRIKFLIGAGGMGEVYLAYHTGLGRECALKLIPPDRVTEIGWRRFQQEARAVGRLNHINIVQVSDLGLHEGCLPYYAMEFVRGDNLADLLKVGKLPLHSILQIFQQVLDGVEYAHRNGIIHRDLKPANIMVDGLESNKPAVKILDFGLAKLTQSDKATQSLTSVGDIFGSPFYMSPEQCLGTRVDNRSDLYSVGCALFESLTGRPPFTGHSQGASKGARPRNQKNTGSSIVDQHIEEDAPSLASVDGAGVYGDGLELLLAKALRKNPVERYQSAGEMRADIERVERREAVQPFYEKRVSRRKAKSQKGSDAALREEKAIREENALRAVLIRLGLFSMLGLFIVVGLGYVLYSSFKPTREVRASSPEASGVNDVAIKVSGLYREDAFRTAPVAGPLVDALTLLGIKGSHYFVAEQVRDGRRYRDYVFPKIKDKQMIALSATLAQEHHIGAMDSHGGQIFKNAVLRGEVAVPVGRQIVYTPSPLVFLHPELLEPFVDGDFDILQLSVNDYARKLPPETKPPARIFKDMHSVKRAWLEATVEEVEDQAISILNSYPDITMLSIHNNLTEAALDKMKCLPNVVQLEINQPEMRTVGYILDRPWRALKDLRLHFMRELSEFDVAKICRLKTIEKITLEEPITITLDDSQIEALSKMPRLKELTLGPLKPTARLMQILKHWQNPTVLRFDPAHQWTPAQLLELRKVLPHCQILCYERKINKSDPF